MGRNTPSAIQQINEILAQHPRLCAGAGSLAAYMTPPRSDESKKRRPSGSAFCSFARIGAAAASCSRCPIPAPWLIRRSSCSPSTANPDRIVRWLSREFAKTNGGCNESVPSTGTASSSSARAQRELQAKYWRIWSLEVRCERLAGVEKSGRVAGRDGPAHRPPREALRPALLGCPYHAGPPV